MKKILHNQQGVALVTAVSFGLISSILVAVVWFMVTSTNTTVKQSGYYNNELENARGLASLVAAEMKASTVKCNSGSKECLTCTRSDNCTVDIAASTCTDLGKTTCTNTVQADYLGNISQESYQFVDGNQIVKTTYLHGVRITSKNEKSVSFAAGVPEQASVEVVYKTEILPEGWVE
ncbi:MAG: hypothetical protein CSA20_07000 [Deltaproteobacteria bacterium]|nr:MAG: hypothetical protein CSA20_07000 [Deltaproteobacteria bacterium]